MNRQGSDVKEDQGKKLFVGGIHHKTEEQSLRDYFSKFGEIVDVVVMKDSHTGKPRGFGEDLNNYFSTFGNVVDAQVVMNKETNESRGFAFVTFDDTDAVDKVILARPHMVKENKIDVRKALSKEEMGKLRSRPPRGGPPQYWNHGPPDYRQQGWNQGYNQGYGASNYGPAYGQESYGNGYNYESSTAQSWDYPPNPETFGSYPPQQPYSGGPMRGGAHYPRPTPYGGPNNWQQR
ncbi:unnamed protein product [Dibothriocephalus latus]|uniref:RRM domain-containing protein n=1 Tax=Dibothriocephalus latus TaxID=60516 RepID=A0A3P7L137_DIBLA|nr:unnamed protein product [Dibothriocephalus latus]